MARASAAFARRALLPVAALLVLGGCWSTPTDLTETKRDIIVNDNNNTAKVVDTVDKHDKGQHDAVSQSVLDVRKSNEELKKQLEEEIKARKAAEGDLSTWINAGIGSVAQIFSGNFGGVAKTVTTAITDSSQTKEAANTAETAVRKTIDEKYAAASDETKKVAAKADTAADDAKAAAKKADANERAVAALSKDIEDRFNTLPADLRVKLKSLGDLSDEVRKLQASASSPADLTAKLDQLLKDRGLSPAEIAQLHDKFPKSEEMIWLLLAGGAGAGGGGLLSRLGKSRGQPEIESNKDDIKTHESRLDALEATRAALTTDLDKGRSRSQDTIDDNTRRLAKLEQDVAAMAAKLAKLG